MWEEQENIYRRILGSNRKMGRGGLRESCLELQRGQVSYKKKIIINNMIKGDRGICKKKNKSESIYAY